MFKWANLFGKKNSEKEIYSPDKSIRCLLELKSGQLFYSAYKNDKRIIKPSRLGFLICGETPLINDLKIIREQKKKHEERIELQWGEDRYIDNNYNETSFYLSEEKEQKRIFTLRFRVFDNAIPFRY